MWKSLLGKKDKHTRNDGMSRQKPSEIIRERAASRFGMSAERDSNDYLREQVRRRFQAVKQHFDESRAQGTEVSNYDLSVLGAGTEMLAFGELDVLEDILDHVPPDHPMRKRYAFYFPLLLPLPNELKRWSGPGPAWPEGIREWYRENKHRLSWSEEQGRFLLTE